MKKKILRDLNRLDSSNIALTKKILSKIHDDIIFNINRDNLGVLLMYTNLLNDFLPSFKDKIKEQYQGFPTVLNQKRRVISELERFYRLCHDHVRY